MKTQMGCFWFLGGITKINTVIKNISPGENRFPVEVNNDGRDGDGED